MDGLDRERSADDRRVWLIRLTNRGRRLASQLEVSPWELLSGAIGSLSAREKTQLLTLLGKVAEAVRRAVESDGRLSPSASQSNHGGSR